nr:hypothetical protein [Tanacetum cinerariifolium]
MPPGIEEDDYDSERDILILEELLDNYSLSLSKNESFYFDIPSSSRPPAKPPDEHSYLGCSSFPFYPLDQFKYGGIRTRVPLLCWDEWGITGKSGGLWWNGAENKGYGVAGLAGEVDEQGLFKRGGKTGVG